MGDRESEVGATVEIFTERSVLGNEQAGAGFVILRKEKSFYLGKRIYAFTAELVALLMAL